MTQWDNKQRRSFTNYAHDFSVFNLEQEHEIFNWQWIRSRRDQTLSLKDTNKLAPGSWQVWIKKGSNYLDRARRRVSRLSVEKSSAQKPESGTETARVLEQIYEYYAGRKHKFEALAEVISEKVLSSAEGNYEKGWITSAGSDGGADFIASVRLGSEFATAKIIVLGQAKCVSLDSPTHGNYIARTVARLKRGWLDVFVTTSYFSEAVQQEIIQDRYPIVLIHGKRLAEEVIKIVHNEDKYNDIGQFLDELTEEYPLRIQQRQPEEILY